MLLRSIGKCLLSRSKNANLLSRIPPKSGLVSRPVVRSGLLLNSLSSNKSTNTAISTRSYHLCATAFAKRTNINRSEQEDIEHVKPVDFGKPVQRVAKIIASYGQCTKAQAEVLIEQGRVKVNGDVIKEIPTKVPIDSKIYVDGTLLKKPRPRVFIHYKKKMFLAKLSFEPDPKGRRNLFAVLQAMGVPSVVPIDTLDYSSEGIMLLTNDSMYKALLAKTAKDNWQCLYRLKTLGEVTEKFITKSADKVTHKGEKFPGINIKIENSDERDSSYNWLTVTAPASVSHVAIKDHFKRHNILVSRLMRLTYGPYSLDNINAGDVHEVPIKVIEKNIIKEGEELPTIEDLAEVGPKKRKLTRREQKLKNKGLLDPQEIRERTRSTDKNKADKEEDVEEEDIMDEEDFEDDIDDDEVEEVKPRKSLDKKRRDTNRQFAQPKRANAFDKNKPLKGRFVSTKPWEKNSKPWEKNSTKSANRRRDEDDIDQDDEFERKAPSRAKPSYRPKREFSGEKKPFKGGRQDRGGRQEYKNKKFSGPAKKRTAPREDDD